MVVDLLILGLIGCLLEGLTTKMCGMTLAAGPTFTFSLLIIFISTARWNLWGLILCPILPLATILGGRFNDLPYFAAMYDWRVYVSTTIALFSIGVNVIFYKRKGTKNTLFSIWRMMGLVLLDYALFTVIQFLFYRLLSGGTLLESGMIEFTFTRYLGDEKVPTLTTANLCGYVESGMVYNLLGLAIAVIGLLVLRSQGGIVNNVRDKLIEDKKNAELDRIDAETFQIKEDTSTPYPDGAEDDECKDTVDSSEK